MAPKRSREMMASKPTTTRRSTSKRLALAKDKLSSLTDNVLHNIMSFLPARQAVQTCVLSRRWANSWRSMPCLDIDQQEFDAAVSKAGVDCKQAGEFGRFEEFVNNLLMFHRASPLHRFRCRVVAHRCDAKAVERWIRHGIKCGPAVMEISWSSSHAFVSGLPHSDSIASRLKRLHLDGITLGTGFAQQICSSYAVLEDLHLERCLLDSPEITSHTLKSLTITDSTAYFGTVLTITAPALGYLHLDITNWAGITVNEMMSSLVKASIRSKCHLTSCKLLCSLENVRMLELSGSNILSILHYKASDAFPTFHNLRTLLFDRCNLNEDFKTLGCFLNNAPSLENLTLHYCELPGRPRCRHNRKPKNLVYTRQYKELTVQCAKLKRTDIKNKLSGIWSNLQNSSITVTKV